MDGGGGGEEEEEEEEGGISPMCESIGHLKTFSCKKIQLVLSQTWGVVVLQTWTYCCTDTFFFFSFILSESSSNT